MLNNRRTSSLAGHTYLITQRFLSDIGHAECTGVYQRIIDEAEAGILQAVMEHTKGNQTKASQLLGMTRTTLRLRLTRHNLK